jgi:hypothetical protein
MNFPIPNPDGTSVIELDERTARCVVVGCGGTVVRHSLGAGMSVDRCTRCFRRYQVRRSVDPAMKSRLQRFVHDFKTWRD